MKMLFVSRWRFVSLLLMVGVCFATVLVQLWWLHVMSAPHLRAEAYRARLIYREKAASRGQIVDSRGTLLAATTREVWDIVVDAHALSESERKQSGEVARILGIDVENVEKAFTKSYREPKKNAPKPANDTDATPAPVAALKPVPATAPAKLPPVFFRAIYEKYFKSPVVAAAEDTAAPDEAAPVPIRGTPLANGVEEPVLRQIEKLKIKGIYGNRRFIREYPKGRLASHLIGYLDRAGKAQMGVEKSMDWFLVGQRGSVLSKRDGKRTELPEQRQREIEPMDGQRVELTIDSFVQEVCEAEALRAAAEYHPKSVVIIVSEAATGKLLGLANWPDFDLREPAKVQDDVVKCWPDYDAKEPAKAQESARRNRAIADIYDPGSVFKIVPVCMGLNEGIVTPDTLFDCSVSFFPYRGRQAGPFPTDTHHMGVANVRDIVRESSNRGAALIAMRVTEAKGEQVFYDYARRFGFGQPSGLQPGSVTADAESGGILHKPADWDGLTITRMPMGHSVSATPLQMHYAMGVVASGGKLFAPRLINRVLNADGTVAFTYKSQVRTTPITPQVARTMAIMLRDVCRAGGTGSAADIKGYEVAGKTGTSQKYINGVPSTNRHLASFSGFFPAETPRLVITVVIDEPKLNGIGYGGKVGAPVFKKVADSVIKCLDIPAVSPPAQS